MSHATLAIGLVMVAFMTWVRFDLVAFLFGDILAVTPADVAIVWIGGLAVVGMIVWLWRPLLAGTVNVELAEAEGMQPERARFIFMLLMALVIAIAMKIVGIMLITSLLIIPAAAPDVSPQRRRSWRSSPLSSAPSPWCWACSARSPMIRRRGPSIVVAALLLFLASLLPKPGAGAHDLRPRT